MSVRSRRKFSYEATGAGGKTRGIRITALGRRILKALDAGTYIPTTAGNTVAAGSRPRRAKR